MTTEQFNKAKKLVEELEDVENQLQFLVEGHNEAGIISYGYEPKSSIRPGAVFQRLVLDEKFVQDFYNTIYQKLNCKLADLEKRLKEI